MWSLKGIGITDVPTCFYSLSGFPKVISSARMRVDVCEGASSRPPFCQGRVSHSVRAEEGAVDGRFTADARMLPANSSWTFVGRWKGEEGPHAMPADASIGPRDPLPSRERVV